MYKYTGTNNNRKQMFHQMGKNKKVGWQPFLKSSGWFWREQKKRLGVLLSVENADV